MTTLELQPYDWVLRENEYDEDEDREVTVIHCWALDRESRPHLLRINNFPVTCFLELPEKHRWNRAKASQLAEELSKRLGARAPFAHTYGTYRKIYYYNFGAKTPMICLSFRSTGDMWNCKRVLDRAEFHSYAFGKLKLPVWETDIKPIRKMLTATNIAFAQWFRARGTLVEEDWRVSTLENEYIVDWETMGPVPDAECGEWQTFPASIGVDIETYSPNHRAMPNALAPSHVVHMISCVYQRLGKPETRERLGIVLGECGPIPGVRLVCVETEEDAILEMARFINEKDPEILTGYNIHKYDFKYLNTRIKTRFFDKCNFEWPNISRLRNGSTFCTEDSWSSSGYGHVQTTHIEMEGRISVDLFPIVKRDYKLDKYTLDFVCRYFIPTSRGKHDVSAVQMFQIYEASVAAREARESRANGWQEQVEAASADTATVMAYCIQDSELVMDLIEELNTWIALVQMSIVMGVTISDLSTRGQQVRGMSQLYNLAAKRGFVITHREESGFSYSGGFVGEPVPGLYDNVIVLDFESMYPSIMMAYNVCWSTLVPPHLMDSVPDEDVHTFEFDQEMEVEDQTKEKEIFESSKRKSVKKNAEKTIVHRKYKVYKGEKGILPSLVEALLGERKAVRAVQGKLDEYSLLYRILEKRQLALKVSANSFYGLLGVANNGKMPLIEGAMIVTYMGRKNISLATDYMTQTYGAKFIYADTDSSMVTLPQITHPDQCQEWGERLAQEISGWNVGDPLPGYGYRKREFPDKVRADSHTGIFPPPLRMAFEKAARMLCLCKKKYAYFKIEPGGAFKRTKDGSRNHIERKGIIIARRGNPAHLQRTYEEILYNILDKQPYLSSLDILTESVRKLVDGEVPPEQLVAIRELGANYANPNFFMALFKTNLCHAGVNVSPGDRLGFVVVRSPAAEAAKLGNKMRLIEKYHENPEPIDVDYYLKNILVNPLDQLISVGHQGEISQLYHAHFVVNCSKNIYLRESAKILYKMYLAGRPASDLRELVVAAINHLKVPRPRLRIVPAQPALLT